MKDVKVNIKSAAFPSQFVSDAEKETKEYGLQIGQAIQYEWFRRDGAGCRFYDQFRQFHRLRLYARGEQSVAKYKNEIAVDGDLSYLNLDWTPVPIIPKFVDIVVNGMSDRLFKVKAYAQDAMSQSKRTKYQDMIEAQMVSKDFLLSVQKNSGFDPFTTSPDELPQTDEELSLYMQINYKPSIEIAEEEAINTIFEENHYLDLRKRCDYDLTVIGISVAKHEFLLGSGVQVSYVDPANVVYSYTEDPHFTDCFYWGEVKTMPIIELMKIDPTLTNEDLEEISKYSQNWYDYYNVAQYYENDMFYRDTCTLLYFNYKTTKKIVFKKKIMATGGSKVIEKDDQFNPPVETMEEGNFEKIEKTIDVWYDGVMVMGTNIVLKWELAQNMVRPKSSSQHAIPNYVAVAPRMYKGNIESLVRRMIPFADLIQITHLKLQQVIARVVPDGVYIDADGLNEVDLGTGGAYNPEDALRLYFQTGSVIGRSYTQEGDYNQGKIPIKELTTSSGSGKTQMLIANYNHYLGMIRQVTGLNEARDASNDLINKIGKYNVSILNDISDLYIYDFGIFIDVAPDEEQRAQLEQNVQMALSKGDINLEDAIDIREIKNLKLANQLLKLKRKQKEERENQQKSQQQEMASQQQMQIVQAKSQADMQKAQMEMESKMQLKQAEIAFEIEKMNNEANLKKMLMAEEFNYNLQLHGMTEQALESRETQRETAKGKRISQQNTEQSQLINQRKTNLPPKNFESNEDSLDGFDLAEFDPR